MESSLITTGEAAAILGITRPGVAYLIRTGELLVAARVGTRGDRLLDRSDVQLLMKERSK